LNKDWTGNKKSTFVTLGASSHTDRERQEDDYYATDPKTVFELLSHEIFSGSIWECCCGEGHLSKELVRAGFDVVSTDLIDRGYGQGGVDFFLEDKLLANNIITNPPYKYATQAVEHSIKLGADKVAMFLKLTFLEGKARNALFKKYPPKKVWVYSSRRQVAINGDPEMFKKSSAAAYAWFVWEKGYEGDTTIGWIL
jgi:hypothetical protein